MSGARRCSAGGTSYLRQVRHGLFALTRRSRTWPGCADGPGRTRARGPTCGPGAAAGARRVVAHRENGERTVAVHSDLDQPGPPCPHLSDVAVEAAVTGLVDHDHR